VCVHGGMSRRYVGNMRITGGRRHPMARLVVTGGTGELGSAVVRELLDAGYTVRVMSRRERGPRDPEGIEWAQVDLERDTDCSAAVVDVDAIVHAATGTGPRPGVRSLRGQRTHSLLVDVEGTKRLLEQARAAGVGHILYVSIVGIEYVPFYYYQRKLAAEALTREGGIPWSILRATQFHSLLDYALQQLARWPVLPLPTDFQFQTVASAEVARRIRDAVANGPGERLPDFGGPEVLKLGDMAHAWLAAHELRRRVLPLWLPGRIATGARAGRLTCPDHRDGSLTWAEWLRRAPAVVSA